MKSTWDLRIERASELQKTHSAVAELLNFYQQLARFQKSIYQELAAAGDHDIAVLKPYFASLISLLKQSASPSLVRAAEALAEESPENLLELLNGVWQHQAESHDLQPEYALFAQALLQPYAECLANRTKGVANGSAQSMCPFCGSKPLVAVLRPEGDGGKRFLLCGLCFTEWEFRRLVCPGCGEEKKESLPVYVAQEFAHVRVDACDTCHTYLKSIDLTKDGRAVPVVDELATVSLNLWAQEHKYQKLAPNLFGV